jgi:hypothetical protein
MNEKELIQIHIGRIEILLKILPYAVDRSERKLFFKRENKLNNLVSQIVGQYYILDLSEKENDFIEYPNMYKNICEAYDYILNVVDNTSESYDETKISKIKKNLNIK